jgi:hypothetical protein
MLSFTIRYDKVKNMKKVNILIPKGYKPGRRELDAARVLAGFYKTTAEILRPSGKYKEYTPDFKMHGALYELKTPETSQVRKILTLIREASGQADNIVIDMRWTKIIEKRMVELAREALADKRNQNILKIVIIVNRKKILEIGR